MIRENKSFSVMVIGIALLLLYATLLEFNIRLPIWIAFTGGSIFFAGSYWHFSRKGTEG